MLLCHGANPWHQDLSAWDRKRSLRGTSSDIEAVLKDEAQVGTSIPCHSANLLRTLDLSENGLDKLPEVLFQLTALRALIANANALTGLSGPLEQLTGLETLVLCENKLAVLPAAVGQLVSLKQLDVSKNNLSELPDSICQLRALQNLDLKGNRLAVLPHDIGQLADLQELYVNGNRLSDLPESFCRLKRLEKLSLSNNMRLSQLCESLCELTALQELSVGGNFVRKLPCGIGQLRLLKRLTLNGNKLSDLPVGLTQLTALRHLDLSNNRLSEVPKGLVQLTMLQELILGVNRLQILPEWLGQLTALQVLILNTNRSLWELPDSLWQLTGLRTLSVSGTRLTKLPGSVGEMTSLQHLELSGCGLNETPGCIKELTGLLSLEICRNYDLPMLPELGPLTKLTCLKINELKLTELPTCIGQLVTLEALHASQNLIVTLPESLGQLASLTHLELSNNKLEQLPKSFRRLTLLQRLILQDNRLGSLSEDNISDLTALLVLNMRSNNLSSLPDGIGNLSNLTHLDISDNDIVALPKTTSQLSALQVFNVSENKIVALPPDIGQLTKLQSLNLSNNSELSELPVSMGHLVSLEELNTSGIHMRIPPQHVLDIGAPKAAVEYLANLSTEHSEHCSRVRVLLLGQKFAGKTLLRKTLCHGPPWQRETGSGRTAAAFADHELESNFCIEEWKPSGKENFVFEIWDWEGKSDFKDVHRAFITSHALYVLVWKLGEQVEAEESLKGWLDTLQRHQPESKIMLVATHYAKDISQEDLEVQRVRMKQLMQKQLSVHKLRQDRLRQALETKVRTYTRDKGIDKPGQGLRDLKSCLQRQYEQDCDEASRNTMRYYFKVIKELERLHNNPVNIQLVDNGASIPVDSRTGDGFATLMRILKREAGHLPCSKEKVPRALMDLHSRIRSKDHKGGALLPKEFETVAAELGIPPGYHVENAINYLCSLGWAQRYVVPDLPELDGIIFLNPHWTVQALLRVVGKTILYSQEKTVKVKLNNLREKGHLDHDLLDQVWADESETARAALRALMEHLDILVSTTDEQSLIPCQLDPMGMQDIQDIVKHCSYKYCCRVVFPGSPDTLFARFLADAVQQDMLPHAELEGSNVLHNDQLKVLIMCETKVHPSTFFNKDIQAVLVDLMSDDDQMHISIMSDDDILFRTLVKQIQETANNEPGIFFKVLLPCPECQRECDKDKKPYDGWYFDADCIDGNANTFHGRLAQRHTVSVHDLLGASSLNHIPEMGASRLEGGCWQALSPKAATSEGSSHWMRRKLKSISARGRRFLERLDRLT